MQATSDDANPKIDAESHLGSCVNSPCCGFKEEGEQVNDEHEDQPFRLMEKQPHRGAIPLNQTIAMLKNRTNDQKERHETNNLFLSWHICCDLLLVKGTSNYFNVRMRIMVSIGGLGGYVNLILLFCNRKDLFDCE
jgi:hypothetical protein